MKLSLQPRITTGRDGGYRPPVRGTSSVGCARRRGRWINAVPVDGRRLDRPRTARGWRPGPATPTTRPRAQGFFRGRLVAGSLLLYRPPRAGLFPADRPAAGRRCPRIFLGTAHPTDASVLGTLVSRPQMGRQDRHGSMRAGHKRSQDVRVPRTPYPCRAPLRFDRIGFTRTNQRADGRRAARSDSGAAASEPDEGLGR